MESVFTVLRFEEFPSVAHESYDMITRVMNEKQALPSSPLFVCYHNADLEQLDVEMGFLIAKELPLEHAQIPCHLVPSQRVVSALFRGPYEESDVLSNGLQSTDTGMRVPSTTPTSMTGRGQEKSC